MIGTRGQQDDPRLLRRISNASCAAQPTRKGATATSAEGPSTGQVT